jgi:predicted transcriptional regulator
MATIIEMAAEILTSHAYSTQMSSEELIAQLQKIHSTLQALESGSEVPPTEESKPALSGKQSIKKNEVICLLCNKGGFKTLTRHLTTAHQIKPRDYKKQFGIPAKQSLSAKSLTESRKQSAKDRGLGDNLAKYREAKAAKASSEKIRIPASAAIRIKPSASVPAVKSKAPVPAVRTKAPVPAKTKKK